MSKYDKVSPELLRRMESDAENGTYPRVAAKGSDAIRRDMASSYHATIWRPAYAHDIDRVLYCPFYNRYTDKTQVFSLFKNDDITRRSLHVQLVSRIARTIGGALHLNLDLIEAISLGHDIGHPPFAHTGETYLDELFCAHTGLHFSHSIHSVRVLDGIYPYDLSLQTLNGIACHNGEMELEMYEPKPMTSFDEFDEMIRRCYEDKSYMKHLIPSTLEGCVVRVSDIIAYLGKDRQDAVSAQLLGKDTFEKEAGGSVNSQIINSLVVNIIENSYGKPYICMDHEHFVSLQTMMRENYAVIYTNQEDRARLERAIKPMMSEIYEQLLDDLKHENTLSPIYTHHIAYVKEDHHARTIPYEKTEPNQLIVDYIASMTDDYFIDLYHYLFPESDRTITYKGYFD